MADFLNSRVLDNGLSALDVEADKMFICSSAPATFTEATSTYALGSKTFAVGAAFGSPADATPSGRKVNSVAITDGAITASGNAGFWAVVDSVNSRLLAAGSITTPQAVVSGNTFSMNSVDVTIPGPA